MHASQGEFGVEKPFSFLRRGAPGVPKFISLKIFLRRFGGKLLLLKDLLKRCGALRNLTGRSTSRGRAGPPPRGRRLSSAPPRDSRARRLSGCAPSRAHLLSSAPPSRAHPLSSAPPLECAASLPSTKDSDSHITHRKRPARLTDYSVRRLLPEHLRPRRASRHRGEGPFRVRAHCQPPRALARLSSNPEATPSCAAAHP